MQYPAGQDRPLGLGAGGSGRPSIHARRRSHVRSLPTRIAASDDPDGVADLLGRLREAGAGEQAAALAARLSAAGMFRLFLEQEGRADQFRFGRGARPRHGTGTTWTDRPPSRPRQEQERASAAPAGVSVGGSPSRTS